MFKKAIKKNFSYTRPLLIGERVFGNDNVMSGIGTFIVLNEEDLVKKQRNWSLLREYIVDNADEEKTNNEEDFLNVISTICMFIGRVYNNNLEILHIIEKINSYKNYLIKNEKRMQLRIS